MSIGERSKFNIVISVNIETLPIATFKWNESNGLKLRELREAAGYSRAKLSEVSGISATYLQQLETPKHFIAKPKKPSQMTVSADILIKLCKILNGSVTSLFWETDTTVEFTDC
jgi:transcriptional regulator with XRE-family HTH domain